MDMKIGEVREFEGKKYMCEIKNSISCKSCYFRFMFDCDMQRAVLGSCFSTSREDNKNIIFVEVKQ